MDAYDIQQELFKAWQGLANKADAASIKKQWTEVPVYVETSNGIQVVKNIRIEDNKIIMGTK